jgi:hypothetical protein
MKKFLVGGFLLAAVSMLNICAYADDPVVGLAKRSLWIIP